MDNFSLKKLILQCSHLTETFRGVWSADNFPTMEDQGASFQIVNTEPSSQTGKHWILLCRQRRGSKKEIVFWDSLGKEPKTYKKLYTRLTYLYEQILTFNHPLQSHFSNCCGLYCLLMAHHLPNSKNFETVAKVLPKKMVDEQTLVRFINYHYKTNFEYKAV